MEAGDVPLLQKCCYTVLMEALSLTQCCCGLTHTGLVLDVPVICQTRVLDTKVIEEQVLAFSGAARVLLISDSDSDYLVSIKVGWAPRCSTAPMLASRRPMELRPAAAVVMMPKRWQY